MASALEHVAWETCLVDPQPDRALEAYARQRSGIPVPSIRYFTPVPWLARALIDLHPEYGLLMHLDQNVADLEHARVVGMKSAPCPRCGSRQTEARLLPPG
jgi:hypothetical protein